MEKMNKNLIALLIVAIFIITLSFASTVFAYGNTYEVPVGVQYFPDEIEPVPNGDYNNYPYNNNSNNYTYNKYNYNENNNYAVNPSPIIYSIDPESANAGSESITVTVTGANFIPSSIAEFENLYKPTSYLDSKHLVMTLNKSDLASAGTYGVMVFNPAPGGGNSNIVNFTVTKGGSTSTDLGANAFGAGFMPHSIFEWILLFLIILAIVFFVRKFTKKRKVTFSASNITADSVTLNATGLIPNAVYMFQVSGPYGPAKVEVTANNDGMANVSFSKLTPGSHYSATLSKYDPATRLLSSIGAPVLYFDTLKQA